MDEVIDKLMLPQPAYVKMDVDGIEHLILRGGNQTLKNVKGLLIEINDEFQLQREDSSRLLHAAGLVLKEKRQADISRFGQKSMK